RSKFRRGHLSFAHEGIYSWPEGAASISRATLTSVRGHGLQLTQAFKGDRGLFVEVFCLLEPIPGARSPECP
ncbi:MAG: hypothetical protein NT154_46505, partial [Verrucomicrobia bacterium]|nr:hypothetical protein [Verrucomicrobiota bacterium]